MMEGGRGLLNARGTTVKLTFASKTVNHKPRLSRPTLMEQCMMAGNPPRFSCSHAIAHCFTWVLFSLVALILHVVSLPIVLLTFLILCCRIEMMPFH